MPTTAHWNTLPTEVTNGVTRTLFAGEGADLKRIVIPAGTSAPRHDHPHEQFILVQSGTVVLTTATGTVTLAAGSVIRLEAGAWHEAEFPDDTVIVEVNLRA